MKLSLELYLMDGEVVAEVQKGLHVYDGRGQSVSEALENLGEALEKALGVREILEEVELRSLTQVPPIVPNVGDTLLLAFSGEDKDVEGEDPDEELQRLETEDMRF